MILGHKRRARLALFEKHLGWARSLGRSVAKGLPPSFDAADLEQIAAAEHWKQTGLYDPARGVPYQGFALQAIRGACYMSVRRDTYRDSTMEPIGNMDVPDETQRSPELETEQKQFISTVLGAMSGLPNAHRRVLELHYLDGLPLVGCAKRMRYSQHSIYELKERAMAALRERLGRLQPIGNRPGILDALWAQTPRLPNADEQAGDWGEDARRGQEA